MLKLRLVLLLWLFCVTGLCASAQNGPQLPDVRPFTPVQGSGFENVSQTNGSLNVHIPLASIPQRGKLKLEYWLAYGNPSYSADVEYTDGGHPVTGGGNYPACDENSNCTSRWMLNGANMGLYITSSLAYSVTYEEVSALQDQGNGVYGNTVFGGYWQLTEPSGNNHRMLKTSGTTWRAVDGSGFVYDTSTCIARDGQGTSYQFTCSGSILSLLSMTDSDGNHITNNSSTVTDTRGQAITSWRATGSNGNAVDGSCPSGTTIEDKLTIPGILSPVVACYSPVQIRTYLFAGNASPDNTTIWWNNEYAGPVTMMTSVTMPTSYTYTFEYKDRNDTSVYNYGELTRINLPTGGYIHYIWGRSTSQCGVYPVGGTETSGVIQRDLHESSSAAAATWQYNSTVGVLGGPNDIDFGAIDPYQNRVVHSLDGTGCSFYDRIQKYQNASGTTLKTVSTDFMTFPSGILVQTTSSSTYDRLVLPTLPTAVTTTWADGLTRKTGYLYDGGFTAYQPQNQTNPSTVTVPYGKLIGTTEYAYGSSAAGLSVSATTTSYKALTQASTFGANNFLDLKDTESTADSSSGLTHTAVYGYDDATHGNLTSLKRHLSTTGFDLETTFAYTPYGMINYQKLPTDTITPDTTTSSDYSSTYQGAVPTTITDALSHSTTATYDPASLRLLTVKDANNQTTTYDYYGDGRLNHIYRSDGGVTTYTYPSANEVDETVKQDNSTNVVTKTFYDGLGRKIRTATQGGCADGSDISVETTYDLMDRVRSVTNPHCGSGSYGTTYYGSANLSQNDGYDALGRPVLQSNPDGTTKTWFYNDRSIDPVNDSVKVTDEAGHTTAQITDALGHLIGVVDANGVKTTYTMNAFGDLTDVVQVGTSGDTARTRHFTYDSLERLLAAQNPEAGTTTYTYDNHNNLKTKTDGRGVVSEYTYDALNRVIARKVSGGNAATQSACYIYGSSSSISTLGVNRLLGEWTQSTDCPSMPAAIPSSGALTSKSISSYDPIGRPQVEVRCILTHCNTATPQNYNYDYAGNVTSYNDGRGVYSFLQSFDSASRLQAVHGVVSGVQTPVLNILNYDPAGWSKALIGNILTEERTFDNRMRLLTNTVKAGVQ